MNDRVAVVGAGVIGSATALALARRGAEVELLEAEAEPGLCASGTNSGILHTGFDSAPGELETEMILRAAEHRSEVFEALGVPLHPCGGLMRAFDPAGEGEIDGLVANAARNGVEVSRRDDGALEIPSESITDPVAYTQALAAAAGRHGAGVRTGFRVAAVAREGEGLRLSEPGGEGVSCRIAINCAGLGADAVARAAGDERFEIYPRKGEFLVFDPPAGDPLDQVLLPVPEAGTKGVLVFPTVDGHVVAGPTAVDGTDKGDWSVREEAAATIRAKAERMYEPLAGAEPIAAYAGLRTAARDSEGAPLNYVIGPSPACESLVNVAAIRSTGMTASLGIAERVTEIVAGLGIELGAEAPLSPAPAEADPDPPVPWWRRAAEYRGLL